MVSRKRQASAAADSDSDADEEFMAIAARCAKQGPEPLFKVDTVPGEVHLEPVTLSGASELPTSESLQPGPPRQKRKKKGEESSASDWFSLPKQDLTPELAAELKAIRLRAYMDPKRFYKGNDTNELPTHFQIGVLSDGGTQPKRKAKSLLETALSDESVHAWTKKREAETWERNKPAPGSFRKQKAKTKKKLKARR
jgi:hypothetical protein